MTEVDWLDCHDPDHMLNYLSGTANDRKLRLSAVAACRRVWHLLPDERIRRAVEVTEQFIDGTANEQELRAAVWEARLAVGRRSMEDWQSFATESASRVVSTAKLAASVMMVSEALRLARTARAVAAQAAGAEAPAAEENERGLQCNLLRDVFGNPFHAATIDRSWLRWREGVVPNLAQVIYNEHRFRDLPILADALEEAGCDDEHLLGHCRDPGEHARGCWAVDLVLGKN
jgi:hypothetical protein